LAWDALLLKLNGEREGDVVMSELEAVVVREDDGRLASARGGDNDDSGIEWRLDELEAESEDEVTGAVIEILRE
jgi:hypothetical protein